MSNRMDLQESFLKKLRSKLKHQPGMCEVLWKLSYSFMSIIVCFSDDSKHLLDLNNIKTIINKELESNTFKSLCGLGFMKDFKIKNKEKDIHYRWERARDKNYPHGKVTIFACNSFINIDYEHDEAGSSWKREGFGKWELLQFSD